MLYLFEEKKKSVTVTRLGYDSVRIDLRPQEPIRLWPLLGIAMGDTGTDIPFPTLAPIRHGKKIRIYGYSSEFVLILTGNIQVDRVWVRIFSDN